MGNNPTTWWHGLCDRRSARDWKVPRESNFQLIDCGRTKPDDIAPRGLVEQLRVNQILKPGLRWAGDTILIILGHNSTVEKLRFRVIPTPVLSDPSSAAFRLRPFERYGRFSSELLAVLHNRRVMCVVDSSDGFKDRVGRSRGVRGEWFCVHADVSLFDLFGAAKS